MDFCLCLTSTHTLLPTASTRRRNSRVRGTTRTRATLHTSTNEIGCSTKRCGRSFFLACYLINAHFRLRDITTNTPLRFGRALSVELHCSSYTLVPYCTLIQIVLQREFRQHARNGCTTSNKIKTTYLQGTSQSVKQRVRFERTTYELRMAAAVIGSK